MSFELLKKIYYDPENAASFSSVEKLFVAAHKIDSGITRDEVKDWLKGERVYTLHKPKRRYFMRNHVIATSVDELWQADLVDMQAFKAVNKGYGYILTMVDVISKFAHAVAIKTKHGPVVATAFDDIFIERKPCFLQTDQGKEFLNAGVQKVLKDHDVHYYSTKDGDVKCSLVERFNRTLRSRMFRYFTLKGSYSYLDVLKKLVNSYNKTEHSATGMRPIDVESEDSRQIFMKLYGFESKRDMMLSARHAATKRVKIGATVRIKFTEKLMDKGYYPSWSDELFTVKKVIKDTYNKPMYIIADHSGEIIDGRFYPEEIQEVTDDSYRIEVIKRRTRRGIKECLVHWVGFPSSQDSWINEKDVFRTDG